MTDDQKQDDTIYKVVRYQKEGPGGWRIVDHLVPAAPVGNLVPATPDDVYHGKFIARLKIAVAHGVPPVEMSVHLETCKTVEEAFALHDHVAGEVIEDMRREIRQRILAPGQGGEGLVVPGGAG